MSLITITANLVSLSGAADVGSCTFELCGPLGVSLANNPPAVIGCIVANLSVTAIANGSGAISQALIPNNLITPAGTTYTVKFLDTSGAFISMARYSLTTSGDLSTFPVLGTSI